MPAPAKAAKETPYLKGVVVLLDYDTATVRVPSGDLELRVPLASLSLRHTGRPVGDHCGLLHLSAGDSPENSGLWRTVLERMASAQGYAILRKQRCTGHVQYLLRKPG